MSDDGVTEEERKRAEADAEARRQRILEKSKARMDKVSGLQAEADAEDEGTKTSSAARMQAMRRRRFKKGAKAKEESSATEETKPGEEKTGDVEPVSTETEGKTTTEEPKEADTAEAETKASEEPAPQSTEAKKEEAPKEEATASTTTEDTTTKKKYKGVAKMRREKMLQKKKEEEAKAAEEEAKNPTSQHAAVQARNKKRLKQPTLPIIMYLVTTFLLFLAGIDVGLQHADESVLVNRDFAPSHFSIQNLNPWGKSTATIKDLGPDTEGYSNHMGDHDEFGSVDDSTDAEHVPNIDPLFRVDLDALTAGPGVLNQLARGAVKIHRLILFFLWELPLQFFSLPRKLVQYPPVMCLVAITIRQLVGKIILGAKLPDSIEEDVRNNKEITDVLTMIKNAVSNTVTGTFPMAVSIYDTFKFLKADMYVMLCGVFVGLVYATWANGHVVNLPPVGTEQAVEDGVPEPDAPVEDVATDSMAEEL